MFYQEKQITFAARSHQLTNINVWTPDSQWIAYDVRPEQSSFTGMTIERINVASGVVEIIYQATQNACVGVVTVNPAEPLRYVFIHGPENPDTSWHYDFHHRRGVIVSEQQPGIAVTLDALDITPPFTPGALRGGSHVHVFSPDGSRLSFTYNDHVMHEFDVAQDLRNVGIALPIGAVHPPKNHPREYDGSHFCVLISCTTPNPVPGSDEISRAYEEGWIGNQGYVKPDGSRQRWALAFIGDTLSDSGEKIPEIFLVDLPESDNAYKCAGEQPIQGTVSMLPSPPAGVNQRRLTFTSGRRYPGLVTSPRHWLRSSPDGSMIAFLMRDDDGVVQLWRISPLGGQPVQLTAGSYNVQSAFSWSPDGRYIAMVMDNSVTLCHVHDGSLQRITPKTATAPLPEAVVFSPDGRQVAYTRNVDSFSQIFVAEVK